MTLKTIIFTFLIFTVSGTAYADLLTLAKEQKAHTSRGEFQGKAKKEKICEAAKKSAIDLLACGDGFQKVDLFIIDTDTEARIVLKDDECRCKETHIPCTINGQATFEVHNECKTAAKIICEAR